MQNPSGSEDKFSMNFGNFDEALFNATHMGGINLGCKRSAHDAGLDGDLGISSDEEASFQPAKKEGKMHAHSSRHQANMDSKGVLLPNGKKTKGRVKIKMEFIDNKLRRYTTFSKRKTGIMKKAYELSTLTGTQVMLLVASETGHVYTFATRKLQPMITSEAGKALIQTCLNSPDPPQVSSSGHQLDQRMSATGYEETELTYAVTDEEQKELDLNDDYINGSSCSGSECSSPLTPSNLSPPEPPIAAFSNSALGGTNGLHGGLPLHFGQGLVITPSATADSNGEAVLDHLGDVSQSLIPVDSLSTNTSQLRNLDTSEVLLRNPTNNNTAEVEIQLKTVSVNGGCHLPQTSSITINNSSSSALSGGSMMTGGLMFPPGGNVVYNPSSQVGGTPFLLNLPPGLQLSPDYTKSKSSPLVSLPMNLVSSAPSSTQSLPTDLSLHIKREENSS